MSRYEFAFDRAYALAAKPFGVTPETAWIEVDELELRVRFGPWRLRTPLANLTSLQASGDYAFAKTAGPAHLSLKDQGVTFATNGRRGVCVTFREKVPGIDPTGRIRHPGMTITPADPNGFMSDLRHRVPGL